MPNEARTATFIMDVNNVDLQQLRTACASQTEASSLADDVWWMPEPTVTRAWFKAIGLYSFPKINDNGIGLTYATLQRSQWSASGQQINIEHGLLPNTQNANGSPIVVGSISSLWLPYLEEGEDPIHPSYAVPAYLLACIWRKQGKEIIEDFRKEELGGWKVSLEVRFTEWDYWWKEQFWSQHEKPELADYVGKEYEGSPVALICGGKDGIVEFQGFGLTKNPAEKGATILQAVATAKGGQAIYRDGIVFMDCIGEMTASAKGGVDNMDAKELAKLLEDAKKEAVTLAKAEWDKSKDQIVAEAVAAKAKEFEPLTAKCAELEAKVQTLTTEKDTLASENAALKIEKRTIERLEALASKKLAVPEKLQESVKEKAKTLEDAEWNKEVEAIEAWASAIPQETKTPLVPFIPTSSVGKYETVASKNEDASVQIDGKTYGYKDLF